MELYLVPPILSSWYARRQVHLHGTRRFVSVFLPAWNSPQILNHMNPVSTCSFLPSGLTKKIRLESIRLCYEGQLENMFAAHLFWVLYFRSDNNIPDLTVIESSYFSTWYPQLRYLSYPGTRFSILCLQKSVSCINSFRVTSISPHDFP